MVLLNNTGNSCVEYNISLDGVVYIIIQSGSTVRRDPLCVFIWVHWSRHLSIARNYINHLVKEFCLSLSTTREGRPSSGVGWDTK